MKKIFVFTVIIFGSLQVAYAQEATKVATLHSGGKVTVQSIPSEAKQNTLQNAPKTAPAPEQHAFVSHEAVMLKDGTQEMHLKDASGNVVKVITPNKGQSLQETYINYLVKNNLPCACGASSEKEQPTQTATRPTEKQPDSMKK